MTCDMTAGMMIQNAIEGRGVAIVRGETGCGKTLGVHRVLTSMDEPSVMLAPRRSNLLASTGRCTCMTIQQFCLRTILQNKQGVFTTGVLAIDEFHVESTELVVVLGAIRSGMIRFRRLVIISATIFPYHMDMISRNTGIDPSGFVNVCLESAGSHTRNVRYIATNFSPHLFRFNPDKACQIITSILKDMTHTRVVVFLHSPNICEQIHDMLTIEGYSVAVAHGQMEHDHIRSALQWSPSENDRRQVLLATNILETGVTLKHLDGVIDFGICCTPSDEGGLVQRWCSKSELGQRAGRTGRVCDGVIYRIMPEEFYNLLPDIVPHTIEWSRFVIATTTSGVASRLIRIIDENHEENAPLMRCVDNLIGLNIIRPTGSGGFITHHNHGMLRRLSGSCLSPEAISLTLYLTKTHTRVRPLIGLMLAVIETLSKSDRIFRFPRVKGVNESFYTLDSKWRRYLMGVNNIVGRWEFDVIMSAITSDHHHNGRRQHFINPIFMHNFRKRFFPIMSIICPDVDPFDAVRSFSVRRVVNPPPPVFVRLLDALKVRPMEEVGLILPSAFQEALRVLWVVCDHPVIQRLHDAIPTLSINNRYIDAPNFITEYMTTLDQHIVRAHDSMRERREQVEYWRSAYDRVVEEIRIEVAFRPGMASFYEAMDHFHEMTEYVSIKK